MPIKVNIVANNCFGTIDGHLTFIDIPKKIDKKKLENIKKRSFKPKCV